MPKKKSNIYDNILPGGRKPGGTEYRNTGIQEEKAKLKKSFNVDEDIKEDLRLLCWYYEKSFTELTNEALKYYLESKKEILKKARQLRESK